MGSNLGKIIAAVGALGAGYATGKRDNEERLAREEERRWRREDRARMDAERAASADTLGKVGTETINPEETAAVLSPEQRAMMARDIADFGPEAGKSIIDSAARDAATPEGRSVAAGIKPTTYTQDQATGDFIKRMYTIDPARAMQVEAGQMQLDEGRDKATYRKKIRDVDNSLRTWGDKNIQKDDAGNPVLNDDTMLNLGKMRVFELSKRGLFDDAMKTAQDSMQYATRKIQAEQVERQAAVRDAVAAVGMGDYSKAMEVYNRFVPDGSKATNVKANKDGTFTVDRVSAVDGTPLSSGTFKNIDQFVSSLNGLADSTALTGYIQRTFQHDIESRRLGIEGGKLQVAKDAESRAKGKDDRDATRQDAVSKGLAAYADAEEKGDAKGMSAARRTILANGGKIERPEALKPEVKVGQIGDITVSQPTGGGGVVVTNYGPDMAKKGSVTIPGQGSAAGPKQGDEQMIQSGPNKGKTAVFDGRGWVLKQ